MGKTLTDFRILGLHPVEPTDALFEETLELQWGAGLAAAELERDRPAVAEHFGRLYLVEVEIEPPDAEVDWTEVTQPLDEHESSWQVPYDERPVDIAAGRWAFFMHFVNLREPLQTPVGPVPWPRPSPRPVHLSAIGYEAP